MQICVYFLNTLKRVTLVLLEFWPLQILPQVGEVVPEIPNLPLQSPLTSDNLLPHPPPALSCRNKTKKSLLT